MLEECLYRRYVTKKSEITINFLVLFCKMFYEKYTDNRGYSSGSTTKLMKMKLMSNSCVIWKIYTQIGQQNIKPTDMLPNQ